MVWRPTLHGQLEQADSGCLVGYGGVISSDQVHPNIADKSDDVAGHRGISAVCCGGRFMLILAVHGWALSCWKAIQPNSLAVKEAGGYWLKDFIISFLQSGSSGWHTAAHLRFLYLAIDHNGYTPFHCIVTLSAVDPGSSHVLKSSLVSRDSTVMNTKYSGHLLRLPINLHYTNSYLFLNLAKLWNGFRYESKWNLNKKALPFIEKNYYSLYELKPIPYLTKINQQNRKWENNNWPQDQNHWSGTAVIIAEHGRNVFPWYIKLKFILYKRSWPPKLKLSLLRFFFLVSIILFIQWGVISLQHFLEIFCNNW